MSRFKIICEECNNEKTQVLYRHKDDETFVVLKCAKCGNQEEL